MGTPIPRISDSKKRDTTKTLVDISLFDFVDAIAGGVSPTITVSFKSKSVYLSSSTCTIWEDNAPENKAMFGVNRVGTIIVLVPDKRGREIKRHRGGKCRTQHTSFERLIAERLKDSSKHSSVTYDVEWDGEKLVGRFLLFDRSAVRLRGEA